MQMPALRKTLAMVSAVLAVGGVLLAVILFVVLYGALDGMEKDAQVSLDSAVALVGTLQDSLTTMGNEIHATGGSAADLQVAATELSGGIRKTGQATKDLGTRLSILQSLGVTSTGDLGQAGDALINASENMERFSTSLNGHQTNIREFETRITSIEGSVSDIRRNIESSRQTVSGLFGALKLASALAAFSIVLLFGIVFLQSVPELMESLESTEKKENPKSRPVPS